MKQYLPGRGRRWAGIFLLALGLANWGCRSEEGSPSDFASVIIRDHTVAEIRRATLQVFVRHNYSLIPNDQLTDFIFEKEGTGMNTLMYGEWSGRVWDRVKVYIEPEETAGYLLRCDAFRVQGHGDQFTFNQEEQRLGRRKRGRYQDMLVEVKSSLAAPPP